MAHRTSPPRETRFASKFVTHRRLRLLCEALDAASAILVDSVIAASSDEADKVFIALRRGALDAIRLKDEEGAYEAHFVKMTRQMARADIELLWNFLLDYVRKRGRPISKRPIMEAVASFLELAQGTSWRPVLDLLLPTAELNPEFEEVFRAEVVIKPREIRKRDESPAPSTAGSYTASAHVGLSDTSPAARLRPVHAEDASPVRAGQTLAGNTLDPGGAQHGASRKGVRAHTLSRKGVAAKAAMPYEDSVKRFAERKQLRKASVTPAQSIQCGGAVPSTERPTARSPTERSSGAVDNWWENSPPPGHLQVAPSVATMGTDCWWTDMGDENTLVSVGMSGMPPSGTTSFAAQHHRSGSPGSDSYAGFSTYINGASIPSHVAPKGSPFAPFALEERHQQPAMAAMHSAVPQRPSPEMGQPASASLFSKAQVPNTASAPSSEAPLPEFTAIDVAGAAAFADLGQWCDDIAPFPDKGAADGTGDKKKKKKKKKNDKDEGDAGEIPKLPGPRNSGKPRNSATEGGGSLWDDLTGPGPFSMFQG